MSDPVKDAWNGLGEALTQLGQAMRDRYLGSGAEPAGRGPPGLAVDGRAARRAGALRRGRP